MVIVLEQTLTLLGKKECKHSATPPYPSDLVPVSYVVTFYGERNRPGLTLGWGQRRGKLFASSFFLLAGTKVADLLVYLQAVFPQGYTELPIPSTPGMRTNSACCEINNSFLGVCLGAPAAAPALTVPIPSSLRPCFTDEGTEALRGMWHAKSH